MFSDEEEVQDLVQEVYLALYRNAANIQSSESIFGWLKTTTFYQGTKMLKKKRKEVLLSEDGEEMFESIPDDEPEIEEGYMNQEDVQVIRECINRLSDEQKTVLLAYYYDNLKVNEIAEILSLSAGTIKSRLYLARKNLQVHIEEEEKKRGYKLHSFGAVTLALALRMFLQGNMEVAGSVEETIFARVCQGLNFEVSKAVAAQSGLAEQVVQEGTKQAGKGILGKLGVLGAKKVAISVVGIIAAVAIGGAAIGGLNEDAYKSKSEGTSQQVSENRELQQWQIDYARVMFELISMPGEVKNVTMADTLFQEDLTKYLKEYHCFLNDPDMQEMGSEMFFGLHNSNTDEEPELYVEFRNIEGKSKNTYMFKTGQTIEECYIGAVDSDETIKMHSISQGEYWTVQEVLNVAISKEDKDFLEATPYVVVHYLANTSEIHGNYSGLQFATIHLEETSDEVDYVFMKDDYLIILTGNGNMYQSHTNLLNGYLAYAERGGKILEHRKTDQSEILVVCKAYDDGLFYTECEFIKSYSDDSQGVRYIHVDWKNMQDESSGMYEIREKEEKDITEEAYLKMYNEQCEGEINMLTDLQYTNVLERLYEIEFSLAK